MWGMFESERGRVNKAGAGTGMEAGQRSSMGDTTRSTDMEMSSLINSRSSAFHSWCWVRTPGFTWVSFILGTQLRCSVECSGHVFFSRPCKWLLYRTCASEGRGAERRRECWGHTGTWAKWQNTTTSIKAQQTHNSHKQQRLGTTAHTEQLSLLHLYLYYKNSSSLLPVKVSAEK